MEEVTNKTEILMQSLQAFGVKIMSILPNVFGAVMILLLGYLFARLVQFLITKLAERLQINKLAKKANVQKFLEQANMASTPAQLLGKGMKWIILLLVFLMAADTMGWNTLSQEIGKLLGYLPQLFLALIFFIIGTYIATFIRDLVRAATSSLGISTGRILSSLIYYFLLIIISLTALQQAGLDTTIITSNLLIIIGTICLAAAISYGFASRVLLSNILASFYAKKSFKVGQIIEVEGEKGKIVTTTNINVTILKSDGQKVVIPTQTLITNKVKVG